MTANLASLVAYSLLAAWSVFSVYYVSRAWRRPEGVNRHILESVPGVFTTLGIFGTFLGIYIGLQKFDVGNITGSIPTLLEGLKTAFMTSIVGIVMSLIFSKLIEVVKIHIEEAVGRESSDVIEALDRMALEIQGMRSETSVGLIALRKSLTGEGGETVYSNIQSLNTVLSDGFLTQAKSSGTIAELLREIHGCFVTSDGRSIAAGLEEWKVDLADSNKAISSSIDKASKLIFEESKRMHGKIAELLDQTAKGYSVIEGIPEEIRSAAGTMSGKLDALVGEIARNNTEALVNVMKAATEDFSRLMSEVVNRLVQENFEELNNSVQKMNDWQRENMEGVRTLYQSMQEAASMLKSASSNTQELARYTSELVGDNGKLQRIIVEIQSVLKADTGLVNSITTLNQVVKQLEEVGGAYRDTANKVNEWIRQEHSIKERINILLARLEEIEKIKDINQEFWKGTRENMEQGVSIIKNASDEIEKNLADVSQTFYDMLNVTLQNLDSCIQSMMQHYDGSRRN